MGNRITPEEWAAAGRQAAKEILAEGDDDAARRARIAEDLGNATADTVRNGGS